MLKEDSLKEKTVLITGGGTGLGKSMASYFLQLGANIAIVSRKQNILDDTAESLMEKYGGTVLPISCDVRNYEEVLKTIEKTAEISRELYDSGQLSNLEYRESQVLLDQAEINYSSKLSATKIQEYILYQLSGQLQKN